MNRILLFFCRYLLVVLLFAVVYWAMFTSNTTYFLISDQLNRHVDRFVFVYDKTNLSSYQKDAIDNLPITISEYNELVLPLYDELDTLNRLLPEKQQSIDEILNKKDSVSDLATIRITDSISVFRDKMLSEYQGRIDSLERFMAGKDSTEMILQGKLVEMANLQYDYAKRDSEVQTYVVSSYGSFMQDSLKSLILDLNNQYLSLSADVSSLEQRRIAVVEQIHQLGSDFHNKRSESVGFWDFLYYSFCVSTTVNFGDIAPNSIQTRIATLIELLVCMALVGILLDQIVERDKRRRTEN